MFTHEMIAEADKNGKTYQSEYGTYSKKDGFKLRDMFGRWDERVNNMLHQDCWEVIPAKKMTKEEIEKALGYDIEIVQQHHPKYTLGPVVVDSITVKREKLTPLEQQAYDQIVKVCFKK